ncbi:hypothetical protein CASFOL_026008 [Castilleja foliolosa]|uniref:F-box associated beta-propeller type 1 domain-containing protein n=1 Tax=Castilleja foliolosa TaxID=1961234 RepID=A0ABD3CV44_9LAMI
MSYQNPTSYETKLVMSLSVGHLNVVGITRNGVVCIVQGILAQNFTLWNPVTQSVLNIPEPDSPNPDALIGASAGFGFDPSSNEYVIIRIVQFRQETNSYPDVAQCFNFQSGRWDWVENDYHGMLPFWVMNPTCEVVVNDVPYWMVEARSVGVELCLKLAWFDMRTRVFNLELLPDDWLNKFVIMGEIRPGYLGAIVWCSDDVVFDRDLYVWTRNDENGEWNETYRVDIRSKPTGGLLVGFYGDAEIVVELRTDPDRIPFLQMMKIDVVDEIGNSLLEEVDDCYLDGAFFGTCRMMRYRKSLTQMPRIGG